MQEGEELKSKKCSEWQTEKVWREKWRMPEKLSKLEQEGRNKDGI